MIQTQKIRFFIKEGIINYIKNFFSFRSIKDSVINIRTWIPTYTLLGIVLLMDGSLNILSHQNRIVKIINLSIYLTGWIVIVVWLRWISDDWRHKWKTNYGL